MSQWHVGSFNGKMLIHETVNSHVIPWAYLVLLYLRFVHCYASAFETLGCCYFNLVIVSRFFFNMIPKLHPLGLLAVYPLSTVLLIKFVQVHFSKFMGLGGMHTKKNYRIFLWIYTTLWNLMSFSSSCRTWFCNFNSFHFCGWCVHVILGWGVYSWSWRVVHKANAICSPYLQCV